jgi:hypothetical protein
MWQIRERFIQGFVWYWKPEGNTTLGKPRRKIEDNTKMNLRAIVCEDMD